MRFKKMENKKGILKTRKSICEYDVGNNPKKRCKIFRLILKLYKESFNAAEKQEKSMKSIDDKNKNKSKKEILQESCTSKEILKT